VVAADAREEGSMTASGAIDIWALGTIAYEIFSGEPLFGPQYNNEEVLAMLLGFDRFPWEKDADALQSISHSQARRMMLQLLRRKQEQRPDIHTILQAALFNAEQDTVARRQQREQIFQEVCQGLKSKPLLVQEIPLQRLSTYSGPALMLAVNFEEIVHNPTAMLLTDLPTSALLDLYQSRSIGVKEAPCSVSSRSQVEPAFLLHQGAVVVVRLTMLYGDRASLSPLPVAGPTRMRIDCGGGSDGLELQVVTMKESVGEWMGLAVWNSALQTEVAEGRNGRLVNASIHLGLKLKAIDDQVQLTFSLQLKMFLPSKALSLDVAYVRGREFYTNVPEWAKTYVRLNDSLCGKILFAQLVQQT
jgi:hypothetical protein